MIHSFLFSLINTYTKIKKKKIITIYLSDFNLRYSNFDNANGFVNRSAPDIMLMYKLMKYF